MTIYLDIIFLENILMNYIILYATGFVQKKSMKNIRIIIASTIGALYAIITYTNLIPIYTTFFMKLLLSVIIVYIAFENQTFKGLMKNLLLFYLSSFVIGGCAIAMLYMISPQNVIVRNGVFVGTYPMKVTLIAGIVGFTIVQISFSLNKRQIKQKDLICDLEIGINKKIVTVKAYMDSGNVLRDPLTRDPVIIVEKSKLEKVIDLNKLRIYASDKKANNIDEYNEESRLNNYKYKQNTRGGEDQLKIRLIPFKSIGSQNGMLIGIKPEYIKINYNEKIIQKRNIIIGLYDKKISKNYQALIGLEILEKGDKNENIRNVKQSVF